MAQRGLRLLSLDGGGTRGLASIYILRSIMGQVVHGNGGSVRPCEYFNLIAGTGLNGLCALLFARFCYTVDQALNFLVDLSQKLDDVEIFRLRVMRGDVDDLEDWRRCMNKSRMPGQQLEELRQGIVQDAWAQVIKTNISDGLETYMHMENGEFNYKAPSAMIEPGRSKAFVVSSESQGYDLDDPLDNCRQYHVPMLHRTYESRHGKSHYTLYAVALGTVASPDIMKPGVIFPEFITTGAHTVHNPIRLILDECSLVWPGLRVGAFVSIGTGKFELSNYLLESLGADTSEACLEICQENLKIADDFKKFIFPHDNSLAAAFFRFDPPNSLPFAEYSGRRAIESDIEAMMAAGRWSTPTTCLANILRADSFPIAPEDLLALAALASLLHSLVVAGYDNDASLVSDVLSNLITYTAASGEDGSFRNVAIATRAEQLSGQIRRMDVIHKASGSRVQEMPDDKHSEGAVLNGSMSFGDGLPGETQATQELKGLSEYASGAYYYLTVLRRGDHSVLDDERLRMLSRQLSTLLGATLETTQQSMDKLELLLELATLSTLCEAATVQALRMFKSLSHNGSLIRRLHTVLLDKSVQGVSQKILGPIADLFALSIHLKNWSRIRDDAIKTLLDAASTRFEDNWSLVNLAVERCNMEEQSSAPTDTESAVIPACQSFLEQQEHEWAGAASELIIRSIREGRFGLLRKGIRGECVASREQRPRITNSPGIAVPKTVLHEAATVGYPYIMKSLLEDMGLAHCKRLVNIPNEGGHTPLHLACKYRAPKEIFRILLILGADYNVKSRFGRAPLHYCFPDQRLLPPARKAIIDMIEEYSLPTIAPIDNPKTFSPYAEGGEIDSRAFAFRIIINQLLWRKADFSIQDDEGITPVHEAARGGWGENIDLFFMEEGQDAERWQRACLTMRDKGGFTLLDHARKSATQLGRNSGVKIIIAEMRKRAMEILPNPWEDLTPVGPAEFKIALGKSSSPVRSHRGSAVSARSSISSLSYTDRQPSMEKPYEASDTSSNLPTSPHFPPAIVHQNTGLAAYPPQIKVQPPPFAQEPPRVPEPSIEARQATIQFPPPLVYQDPEFSRPVQQPLQVQPLRKPVPAAQMLAAPTPQLSPITVASSSRIDAAHNEEKSTGTKSKSRFFKKIMKGK